MTLKFILKLLPSPTAVSFSLISTLFVFGLSVLALHSIFSSVVVMTFHRKRTPIIFLYTLSGFPLERVYSVKDLGIYRVPSLSFGQHINITVGRALKVLGFLKRNTILFTSITCLRSLYFSLIRSILEYGIVVWHSHWAKDQLRLKRVQNRFLCPTLLFCSRLITRPMTIRPSDLP